jgi:hypothetical protein
MIDRPMTCRAAAAIVAFVVTPAVQVATGSIAGTIADKDGGVIPGAAVLREILRDEKSSRVVIVAESLVPLRPNDDIWTTFRGAPLELLARLAAPESAHPVLLNAQVVGRGSRCGNLCGDGTIVWLARESATSAWTIRDRRNFWMS